MSAWPRVMTEQDTLQAVLAGASLSRFGDGELKIADDGGTATHAPDPALAREFREILKHPPPGLVVGVPTMDPRIVNYENWARSRDRWARLLDPDRLYGSAFVGRPSTAPWIATQGYVDAFRSLWAGKRIAAVCSIDHTLPGWLSASGAKMTIRVDCPKIEAYGEIDRIEREAATPGSDLVVACAGPMATALAARLARRGVQCVDLGRGFGFLSKWR